jgi:ferredoxin
MTNPFDRPPVLPAPRTASRPVTPPVPAITVSINLSVDNNHCHLYAICQHEAPEVFRLVDDRRLLVESRPPARMLEQVRTAARLCPMQAISVEVSP